MSVVLDCSVTLSWYLEDEDNEASRRVETFVTEFGGVVPFHWRAEMSNGLLMALRRQRISRQFIVRAFETFDLLPVTTDFVGARNVHTTVLELAETHKLTMYDALYLDSAQRLSLPLATLDKALLRSAHALEIQTLGIE